MLTLFLFLAAAVVIYLACEFFVNAVEWCGHHLGLGATAVGSVLAAFGTALPESAVTFFAVVFGKTAEQKSIGIGAALGGPLVLATISYAVVGLSLWVSRRHQDHTRPIADHGRLRRDQASFLIIFALKVGLGLVIFSWKPWVGILFLLAYGLYVWREMGHEEDGGESEDLEPLKIHAGGGPVWAGAQAVLAMGVIAGATHVFVDQIAAISTFLHLSAQSTALYLSPVATELPETLNAVIWVRQGKPRLALANISGAMMIQATVPSALGILFTPWVFDRSLCLAAGVTALAIVCLWGLFATRRFHPLWMALVGLLYPVFSVLSLRG